MQVLQLTIISLLLYLVTNLNAISKLRTPKLISISQMMRTIKIMRIVANPRLLQK